MSGHAGRGAGETATGGVRRPDAPGGDLLRLVGVRAYGRHGVFEHERRDGQEFLVDVTLRYDAARAAAADDVTATIDYGSLAERIVEAVEGEPLDLIESLAERIAADALGHPLAREVEVTVHKPSAPITVPFADVAVTIVRTRGDGT